MVECWGLWVGVVSRVRSLYHLYRTIRATKTSVTPACTRCMRLTFTVTASYKRTKHRFFRQLYQISTGCRQRRTRQVFSGTLAAQRKSIRLNATFRLTRETNIALYGRRVVGRQGGTGGTRGAPTGGLARARMCGGISGRRPSRSRRLRSNDRPGRPLPSFARTS